MPIEPEEPQIAEVATLAGGETDGPVVMLNLNRYRERAEYQGDVPGGSGDSGGPGPSRRGAPAGGADRV